MFHIITVFQNNLGITLPKSKWFDNLYNHHTNQQTYDKRKVIIIITIIFHIQKMEKIYQRNTCHQIDIILGQ